MASWLVYSEDGRHLGPVPTEYVARAVRSGAIQPNRWVTEANRSAWRPLADVPEIRALLDAMAAEAVRDRDQTVVGAPAGLAQFSGAPEPPTQKDLPSSDESSGAPSERTLIAPVAFEQEMAAIAGMPPRPAAGAPARVSPDELTLAARTTPHPLGPVHATLKSSDAPPGLAGRPGHAVLEPDTATVPAAAWMTKSSSGDAGLSTAGAAGGSGRPAAADVIVAGTLRSPSESPLTGAAPGAIAKPGGATTIARSPSPTNRAGSAPAAPSSRADGNGSVLIFFLGGLALGAVVVVLVLVWAFRGGVLK